MEEFEPLVELHLHLDGSLRIGTMLDIAREEGVDLPARDGSALAEALRCGEVRHSLADYLEAFGVTVSVMQSERALERVAAELMEDVAKDGVRYAEVRFMPSLHTERGLTGSAVMEAVLAGLRRGGAARGVDWGLIVCSMRHVDPSETERLMELAAAYRNDGVVAVDMAGNDQLDALAHAAHYRRAKGKGLRVTIHAAEAGPAERAREAIDLFGAERIGHGIRVAEDPSVLETLGMRAVPFEVCPTSNVQIKQVASYETHPAREYFRAGHLVTLNTDNRMLAGTTLREEYGRVRLAWGLDDGDLKRLVGNAIEASFAPDDVKERLRSRLESNFTPIR